ncbi:MAG: DMT family transporter [Coriobacteriia bacterium]|nr:DMT family transporter [Coriobacteriia bacterium]
MDRRTALAAVTASAACFATLGILTKWAFAYGAEPLSLLAVRFAVAAIVMGLAQAIRSPGSLRVTGRDLLVFLGLSLTGYGAASLCYSFAVREIGPSVTTVMLYTYPALVSVIGWLFLRESFPPRRIAAVLLTFAGCALVADVFAASGALNARGLLLGLGAGLGYAVFNVLSFRALGRTPRLTLMAYTFGFSAIGLGAVAALRGAPGALSVWQWQAWASLALIVAIPTFAAVMLYLGGMKGMGAAQAAVVSTLELPFTVLLATMAFPDERLTLVQTLGAAIVLGGVVLAEWGAAPGEVDGAPVV